MGKFKIVRHPAPAKPVARKILKFADQPPAAPATAAPPSTPASNELAAETLRRAANPGEVDPRQMRD